MGCGSCGGNELLERAVRVVQRIFKGGVRRQIDVDGVRFGFVKAREPLTPFLL